MKRNLEVLPIGKEGSDGFCRRIKGEQDQRSHRVDEEPNSHTHTNTVYYKRLRLSKI